jgi:protein TonB
MFQQLPESNAVLQPRLGGSVVSTVGHGVVIAAIVALTATHEVPQVFQPTERPVYVAPPAPPQDIVTPAPQSANAPVSSVPEPRTTTVVAVPIEIPLGIPTPDFSVPVHNDVRIGGTSDRGTAVGGVPTGSGSAGSGDATWLADQVERPVVLLPGSPTPVFPTQLSSAGVTGGVMAEFVVDTLGRIEPNSIRLLTVDHPQFGASVRTVLPRLKFIPAEVQGRKVRQLVRLPFRFDLH